jgi:hypothetical protein
VDEGEVFGEGAGDSVEGAEFSDAIGSAQTGDPRYACITVSGIGSIEFVAVADPAESFIFADSISDRERIITRYAENVFDAQKVKAVENMLDYSVCHSIAL